LSQRDRVEEALRVYESFRGDVDDQHLLDQPRVGRSSAPAGESAR
jgi:hypothetical protein